MEPRQATVSLLYNGVSATGQISGDLSSFQYKDVASGESDSISLNINDRDHKWIGSWFPAKGDKLQPTIQTRNWTADGQTVDFPCGTFGVDDFSFRGGPISMTLEALALPANTDFKAKERTETYERTTLKGIGEKVAGRAGIALYFDAADANVEKVEQNSQTDCEFYSGMVEKFGLAMKIFNDRLVVFSEADYEAKAPKCTLTPEDFDPGWSWRRSTTGTYTGVLYQYTNSEKNKTFTVKAGTEERTLTVNDPADNLTEATAIALAKLNAANRGAVTMSITMMARPGLIASDVIEISGLENLDGKYYIETITHSIGSGYKMALDLRRIEPRVTSATSVASTVAEGG